MPAKSSSKKPPVSAMNVSALTVEQIIMGGSLISVAVPPIFDAIICISRNGRGLSSSCLVMLNVTGTMSKTVVTLSKNAENTAVIIPK